MNHLYLKNKVMNLWKLEENYFLIDLGLKFYTVKLSEKESQKRIYKRVLGLWLAPKYRSGCGNQILYPRIPQLNPPPPRFAYPNFEQSTMIDRSLLEKIVRLIYKLPWNM